MAQYNLSINHSRFADPAAILRGSITNFRSAADVPPRCILIGGTTICSTVNSVDVLCRLSSYRPADMLMPFCVQRVPTLFYEHVQHMLRLLELKLTEEPPRG